MNGTGEKTLKEWRFLDTGHLSAAENMAFDEVILECRARNLVPNTIRFLQFHPPAVLVGYHQAVEHEVRESFCKDKGIDINRRITGGGAIFFDEQSLGWEIFASKSDLGLHQNLEEIYEKMCEAPILGLKTLGIQASFRPKNDIEVNGRKISGTGGTERDGAFLFQGTLLVNFDVDTMLRALRIPITKLKDKEIKSVKERVTCIKWELGSSPGLNEIKQVLKAGFEKTFGKLSDGRLTPVEEQLLKKKLREFRSKKWIYLERRPLNEAAEVYALDKTPGGLIRVSLALDKQSKIIKNVLITGDFFAYPSRAIFDLEANLKNTVYDEEEIRSAVYSFFETRRVQIPGVTPEDIVQLIIEAAEKINYGFLGINSTQANHIYTILDNVKEILENGCDTLLLPYCAKLQACEFRKKDGCAVCGKCSVGIAYRLAMEAGLKPITILNFEHLMSTLKKLKKNGAKGYIGCCCEAFYCKHQDEMALTGVPGILIDVKNQTCYDLGKEEEALNGNFEGQTELRTNILHKLLTKLRKN